MRVLWFVRRFLFRCKRRIVRVGRFLKHHRNELSIAVSIAILVVAIITVCLQYNSSVLQGRSGEVVDSLTEIQREYTKWVKAQQSRRPVMSLTSSGVLPLQGDTIRVTFLLVNKGSAIAQNVQIVFRLPEYMKPSGQHLLRFSPQPVVEGYMYLKFALSEKAATKIIYFDKDPKQFYWTKLPCTLDFIVPARFAERDSFNIEYRIDCASEGAGDWKTLKIQNPFKEEPDSLKGGGKS